MAGNCAPDANVGTTLLGPLLIFVSSSVGMRETVRARTLTLYLDHSARVIWCGINGSMAGNCAPDANVGTTLLGPLYTSYAPRVCAMDHGTSFL
jgi:hypothetical protein